MNNYIAILFVISLSLWSCSSAIKILVESATSKRYSPYNTNIDFTKDWTNECDVPCVWTDDPSDVDGVFYILRNNWDVVSAYMDKKRAPISIGGSTEGRHLYSLLSNEYFRQIFTASALLSSGSDIPWWLEIGDYRELIKVEPNSYPLKMAVSSEFECDSRNSREKVVLEIDQIMPVTRIGKCLNNSPWPVCGDKECSKVQALRKYSFCLAFESGDIPGYVTERVFDCHRAGGIPIYLGTADVFKFVPQGSIIYAGDFESSFALAYYLVEVATNETLYQSYFDWKKLPLETDFVERNRIFWDYRVQCRVCRYVWTRQQGLAWNVDTQNVSSETGDLSGQKELYLREDAPILRGNGRLRQRSDIFEIRPDKLSNSNSSPSLLSYSYLIPAVLAILLLLAISPYLKILRIRIFSHLWLLGGK